MTPRHLTVAAVALLALAWAWLPEFTVTLLNYIALYALVAVGLVMLTGVGGMTSFGQAAFVGTGAYATAWVCGCVLEPGEPADSPRAMRQAGPRAAVLLGEPA